MLLALVDISSSFTARKPAPSKVYGDEVVSTPDAARTAGLSYRQVNYWIAVHAIRPAFGSGGSGIPYGFTKRQVEILRQISVLYHQFENTGRLGLHTDFIRRVWDALESTGEFHCADGPVVITLPWPADALDQGQASS